MEMHQVRYFLAVAEELHFTRAADKCNVSQPALSRAVQSLEEEFAGPLFWRERGHTRLTDLGLMIRPQLETVFAAAVKAKANAKAMAQERNRDKSMSLKLGIMTTISSGEVIALIAALETKYRGLEFLICDASARDLRSRLIDGDLEVAIYATLDDEPDERTRLTALFSERMVFAVKRGQKFTSHGGFTAQQLEGERYIRRNNCEFAGEADRILRDGGVVETSSYQSERDDCTLAMVAAGLGFAFMPAGAVNHPDVIGVPIAGAEFRRQVNLVTVRGRPYSTAVDALMREAARRNRVADGDKATRPSEPKRAVATVASIKAPPKIPGHFPRQDRLTGPGIATALV